MSVAARAIALVPMTTTGRHPVCARGTSRNCRFHGKPQGNTITRDDGHYGTQTITERGKPTDETQPPVRLLLDACVWLDLAGNFANEPLLSALESLCKRDAIKLIVPSVVREEFARNKERIVRESGRSLSGALKRARVALYTYSDPKKRKTAIGLISDIDHKLSGSGEVASEAVKRIEVLFHDAIDYSVNAEALLAAARHGERSGIP